MATLIIHSFNIKKIIIIYGLFYIDSFDEAPEGADRQASLKDRFSPEREIAYKLPQLILLSSNYFYLYCVHLNV